MKKDPNNKFRKIRRLNNLTQAEEDRKLLNVSIHHISEFENASPQEGNGSMDISLSLILKISSLYQDMFRQTTFSRTKRNSRSGAYTLFHMAFRL